MTNIADLKAHLSDYIEKVEEGEELTVCRHNKPVAKLVPIHGIKKSNRRAALMGSLTQKIRITGEWDGVSSLFTKEELEQMGDLPGIKSLDIPSKARPSSKPKE